MRSLPILHNEPESQGPHLRVILFGEPSVAYMSDTGGDVPMSPRCLNLLAYLLLHPQSRSRERIAATLWPDSLDSEARANLRRTVYDLVRVLPKGTKPWILMDAKRMAWNSLAPLWCDVEAFDRLGRHDATLAQAVDVYGGDFLAGEDAEWAIDLRNRLRERQVEALHALADRCRTRGDATEAIRYYRRLLALDPFREDAFRSLLGLLYAHGDRARAAYVYRDFVNRLRDELGVDPMPETIAFYEQMARGLTPGRPFLADVRELVMASNE
jgi:DNA-binding SARP family transcriptional activator